MRRTGTRLAVATAGLSMLLCVAPAALSQARARPTARGTGGAAATVDALATRAAIRALRHGGNAVDAAITAAGVLGVVEPYSCGIGGGGFMVIRTRKGRVVTFDSRERAPQAMQPNSFFDPVTGRPLAMDPARFSGLSVGVPGTPLAWSRALNHYGTFRLRRALRPGMRIATTGYVVDDTFFKFTDDVKDYFDDVPSTAALYLDPDGTPRDVGERIVNPDLAKTYRILGAAGVRRGFYHGAIAAAIAEAAQHPPISPTANHVWRSGLMTTDDLARYTAPRRKPTKVRYRGLRVYSMGPPSSGGSTVGEVLNILGGYSPLGASREEMIHRSLEAQRYAFADRNAYLADPAYFDVPLKGLLSKSFARERRSLITDRAATSPVPRGDPYDNQGSSGRAGSASATISHPGQSTTHLVTADRRGNVVSYTFTIESTGGNGVVVPGFGFLLNNELTDFNFDSTTHPNRADGGKRPRSSISPTIVTRHGRPWLALGAAGGSTIIGNVVGMLVNRIDLREPLTNALAAPRVVERNTSRSQAEDAFINSPLGRDLAGVYGHQFTRPDKPLFEIGASTALEIRGRHKRKFIAVAEPVRRGGGSAGVVRR
jgi:gamma-glutamyltranspeptidase / glutathione hydrolase